MAIVMLVAGVIALLSLVMLTRGATAAPDAEQRNRSWKPRPAELPSAPCTDAQTIRHSRTAGV